MRALERTSSWALRVWLFAGVALACVAIVAAMKWYRGVLDDRDLGPWEGYYFTTEQAHEGQANLEIALLSAYLNKQLGESPTEDLKLAERWASQLAIRWNVLNTTTGLMSELTKDPDVAHSVALVQEFIPELENGQRFIESGDKAGFIKWMSEFRVVQDKLRDIALKARSIELEQRSKYRESAEASKLRMLASAWLALGSLLGLGLVGWLRWRWQGRQLEAETRSIEIAKEAVEARIDAVTVSAASERARYSFISAVAHELRTPMQSLLSAANLLAMIQGKEASVKNEDLRVIADRIEVAVDQMRIQLKDLTEFAKSPGKTKGELNTELFSIKEWFDAMIMSVQSLEDGSGAALKFTFDGDEDLNVVSDGGRLLQIANNLIGNALKHTAIGEVRVTVGCRDMREDLAGRQVELSLCVEDTGTGISEADLPHVTQPFYRGINATGGQSAGLGLAIVSSLVERMHGEMEIRSELGKGTTVTIKLPLAVEVTRERPMMLAASQHAAPLRPG